MKIDPHAGELLRAKDLINVDEVVKAYYDIHPDPENFAEHVSFGTSGHRGSSLTATFNEDHILAVAEAIFRFRNSHRIDGPLFIGFDTHALSRPAYETLLEVLLGNDIEVVTSQNGEFTPTPVISHAILSYNRNREKNFADGIVITPSHNPPNQGGIKYNPPHGGPAEKEITDWIQKKANDLLKNQLAGIKRIPFSKINDSNKIHERNYITPYVQDLRNVLDMDLIRDSRIKIAVDPLGGAGVNYWGPIADYYKLNLTILSTQVDPQFPFVSRDWDGKIRMDPSSSYVMKSLVENHRLYDVSFACDTDHDRHGIVTRKSGLMPPNDYLSTAVFYLLQNRPEWKKTMKIGKTIVTSSMIKKISDSFERGVFDAPVGFKWFVEGLLSGDIGFAGEESAGATFLRKNGEVWTTDKDGITASLLAAEMTARTQKDPADLFNELTQDFGKPNYRRSEGVITPEQKKTIEQLTKESFSGKRFGGENVESILTNAPGNSEALGGVKIETRNGWAAVRLSGTEDIYKIYAESFQSVDHLEALITEMQKIIGAS